MKISFAKLRPTKARVDLQSIPLSGGSVIRMEPRQKAFQLIPFLLRNPALSYKDNLQAVYLTLRLPGGCECK